MKKLCLWAVLVFSATSAEIVVFDLGQVLFKADRREAMRCLASTREFFDCIFNFGRIQRVFYDHARSLPATREARSIYATSPLYDDKGNKLPPIMIDLMIGNIDAKTLYKNIENMVGCSSYDKRLALIVARMLLSENLSTILKPSVEMFALVRACKENGNKVIVLSNLDKDVIALLKQKHPILFSLFDEVVVSGEVHMAKPCKNIYTYVEKLMQADPQDLLLIDDQKENCDAAETAGWSVFKFTQNPKALKKYLVSREVL